MSLFNNFLILALSLTLASCGEEKPRNTIATHVYTVLNADRDYSRGSLKLAEIEEYKGEKLIKKTYKDEQEKIKGIEKCEYEWNGKKAECNYYDADGNLLSYYKNEYKDGRKVISEGYDASNEELLRIEKFYYDENGHRIRKEILDSNENLQKSYNFKFDRYGNEVQVSVKDQDEKQLLVYDFEIVEKDSSGNWVKQWGYINNDTIPYSYETCTRSRSL